MVYHQIKRIKTLHLGGKNGETRRKMEIDKIHRQKA